MVGPTVSAWLACPACENVEYADADALLQRLRKLGMLRRDASPTNGVIQELVDRMADGFVCSICNNVGLRATREDPLDDEAWGQGRKCQACGQLIPAERIEIFPDTQWCTTCKSAIESGETDDSEPDFCPRCGDVRQLRRRSGSGITGYQMYCPGCRR